MQHVCVCVKVDLVPELVIFQLHSLGLLPLALQAVLQLLGLAPPLPQLLQQR